MKVLSYEEGGCTSCTHLLPRNYMLAIHILDIDKTTGSMAAFKRDSVMREGDDAIGSASRGVGTHV
jgi:hypothetical protein